MIPYHTPVWLWVVIAFCATLTVGLAIADYVTRNDYLPPKRRRR